MTKTLKHLKKYAHLILLILLGVGSVLLYIWLLHQPIFQQFIVWSQNNLTLYFITLVVIKMVGIIWPPLPGGVITLGSIPVIGWQLAYLADVVGGLVGACIAYYLGQKYGYKILLWLFDENALKSVEKIKVVERREIEAVAVLRLFYGTVSEVISYGSGLVGIKFKNFILGVLLSQLAGMPLFYLMNNLFTGRGVVINGVIVLASVLLFFRFRGRYFE